MRSIINFNQDWLYLPAQATPGQPDSDFEAITLPHTNIVLPYHNFDNAEYQFISTYRKRFILPEPRNGRRVFVDFDGAMIASTVFINGQRLGDYEGGYTPFSFDITEYVYDDRENLLTVELDSTERPDIPPYGRVVDYLTFGGVYRDVWLRYVEPVYIADVFVRPQDVLSSQPRVEIDITVYNTNATPERFTLTAQINAEASAAVQQDVELTGEAHHTYTLTIDSGTFRLWQPNDPVLYQAAITLTPANAPEATDKVTSQFGFREAQFRDDGFYLNGELFNLIGLNRHQTYPYIGAAAPKRLQERDAEIVKYELGCNIVRTSHYPQSPHFLRRCDEIGLLVFEEIPGWQHIGDEDWQGISLRDVQAMIMRDRNHPSIVLWGVRINESQDNTAFYTRTNALAHELDPTRQTGGVRYWQESEFLEDVYTFNDFSNSVQEPRQTPHLVTEFNGHMFSTKTFDQEERAVEHAIRHARIHDKQLGMPNVTGAIGWCAFDYNTHSEFGSGDRICYHGVMDIFRLPKFAADFYESQISPDHHVVLKAATYWTMGDRSQGGIDPLVVFTNCDEIDMYTGDQHIGRFQPDREQFPNLPHAPVFIRGLSLMWGRHKFEELRLIGYINGEAVAEQKIAADGIPAKLKLWVDHTELVADGADMTRLSFQITDEYGNRLPYTNQVIEFDLDGPAELIGEQPFALMGGQGALYIKAQHTPGTVTVRATTRRLEPATVTLTIQSPE